jgi:thiamine transporter ThiT
MRFSLFLMAFGGSLAQSSVVPSWSIGGVMPDLPLIMTALIALRRGPETGCLAGFASGLFQDALWVGHPLVQIPGLLLLTVAEGLLRFGLLQLFHYPARLSELFVHVILPQALYNGLVGAACVVVFETAQVLRRRHTWT